MTKKMIAMFISDFEGQFPPKIWGMVSFKTLKSTFLDQNKKSKTTDFPFKHIGRYQVCCVPVAWSMEIPNLHEGGSETKWLAAPVDIR